jgi:hypothetical protein
VSQNSPLAYFHNRTAGGHSLTLRLEGTASNRDAIGARVTVTAGSRRMTAWRLGGGSYQSACDPRIHIGLGDVDRAEQTEVTWPSGRVDRFGPLAADNGYRLREGASAPEPQRGFTPKDTAGAATAVRNRPGPKADRAAAPRPARAELESRPTLVPQRSIQERAESNSLSLIPSFIVSYGVS